MIKAIFFDARALFYGPQEAELLADLLETEGLHVTPAEVEEAFARLPDALRQAQHQVRTEEQEVDYQRAMLPQLLLNLGLNDPTDALKLRILENLHEYPAWWSLYPETLPVLEELTRRGFTLGIVSNWAPSLRRFVAEFEVEHYFSVLLASMSTGLAKPEPSLFRQALSEAGVAASEALHCGPSVQEDVAGALSAGITPVWLNRTGISTGHELLSITDLRGLLLLAQKAGV